MSTKITMASAMHFRVEVVSDDVGSGEPVQPERKAAKGR